ncbi:hypothetical protein A2J03_07515 [Rhodococcus sp. EPR-157]|nr:hypothetical protein A2J03_07515 [Rhodococcus sp. EPR-157]
MLVSDALQVCKSVRRRRAPRYVMFILLARFRIGTLPKSARCPPRGVAFLTLGWVLTKPPVKQDRITQETQGEQGGLRR